MLASLLPSSLRLRCGGFSASVGYGSCAQPNPSSTASDRVGRDWTGPGPRPVSVTRRCAEAGVPLAGVVIGFEESVRERSGLPAAPAWCDQSVTRSLSSLPAPPPRKREAERLAIEVAVDLDSEESDQIVRTDVVVPFRRRTSR